MFFPIAVTYQVETFLQKASKLQGVGLELKKSHICQRIKTWKSLGPLSSGLKESEQALWMEADQPQMLMLELHREL